MLALKATGTIGAVGELIIATDLLSRGFDVFRALSPCSACDLAVHVGDRLMKIEVRTGQLTERSPGCKWDDADRAKKADILAIVLHRPRRVYYLDPTTGSTPSVMREFLPDLMSTMERRPETGIIGEEYGVDDIEEHADADPDPIP